MEVEEMRQEEVDGPDSADMEEERGCALPRKVQGA